MGKVIGYVIRPLIVIVVALAGFVAVASVTEAGCKYGDKYYGSCTSSDWDGEGIYVYHRKYEGSRGASPGYAEGGASYWRLEHVRDFEWNGSSYSFREAWGPAGWFYNRYEDFWGNYGADRQYHDDIQIDFKWKYKQNVSPWGYFYNDDSHNYSYSY